MINNLIDAVEFFRGKNVTVAGWCHHSKVITIDGKQVTLPVTTDVLESVARCIE